MADMASGHPTVSKGTSLFVPCCLHMSSSYMEKYCKVALLRWPVRFFECLDPTLPTFWMCCQIEAQVLLGLTKKLRPTVLILDDIMVDCRGCRRVFTPIVRGRHLAPPQVFSRGDLSPSSSAAVKHPLGSLDLIVHTLLLSQLCENIIYGHSITNNVRISIVKSAGNRRNYYNDVPSHIVAPLRIFPCILPILSDGEIVMRKFQRVGK